jgi:hypothetical protein
MRHEVGLTRLLFGADYPHLEGTWPNTADWIRDAFAGVAVEEARAILGDNARSHYRLDGTQLARTAREIGWRTDEVVDRAFQVDARRIEHFDKRSGYGRAPEAVDTDAIDALIEKDLAGVGHR